MRRCRGAGEPLTKDRQPPGRDARPRLDAIEIDSRTQIATILVSSVDVHAVITGECRGQLTARAHVAPRDVVQGDPHRTCLERDEGQGRRRIQWVWRYRDG